MRKPPTHLQRTDSVSKMIGRAFSLAASTKAQNGDARVKPAMAEKRGLASLVTSGFTSESEKSAETRPSLEVSLRDTSPGSPFLGGRNRRVISRARKKSALTKMRSVHTMASAV